MGNGQLEYLILAGLFNRPQYAARVLPYLKASYFRTTAEKLVYRKIAAFYDTYTSAPTPMAIEIELNRDNELEEDDFKESVKLLQNVERIKDDTTETWLTDQTEDWCKKNALENALREGINIFSGTDKKKRSWNVIPEIVQDALAVSFDPSVGLDFRDFEGRFELYQQNIGEQIKCDIAKLNEQTQGGFAKKTLNVFMGQTNVGKTLSLCSIAGSMLLNGHNVLYVSGEISDLKVAQRIEAKLLDVSLLDIKEMSQKEYLTRMRRLDNQLTGRLFIREYPTATASAGTVRALLNELAIKQNFVPDAVLVDYLNIFRSERIATAENTYVLVKNIAEEFRGLATQRNFACLSATQVTRNAFDASLLSLKDVPESKALAETVDLLVGLIVPPEMRHENLIVAQTLKTRYMDSTMAETFPIGINRGRQQLYDLDDASAPILVQEHRAEKKSSPSKRQLNACRSRS